MASPNRLKDDELLCLSQTELARLVRRAEGENLKLMMDHGNLMKEVNRRMQVHLMEIRSLKEVNQRLQDDNQELRDLCCFLDDDRQKGRKLAREWQRFGRYTASVMRQEVSTYQAKLRELENKQHDMIKDNLELKELCLYLDDERSRSLCVHCETTISGRRDDGDGSSSSTNNEELGLPMTSHLSRPSHPPPPPYRGHSRRQMAIEEAIQRHRSVINQQVLNYIRSLELKVQQMDKEKRNQSAEIIVENDRNYRRTPPAYEFHNSRQIPPSNDNNSSLVLEVHERLENAPQINLNSEHLAEGEKALVREMCNVVWKKLEDGPN